MTDRWHDYFDRQGVSDAKWLAVAVSHWGFHEVLYGMIQRYCPAPARILDVGCGPGWSALYLASSGYSVYGVDNESRLIEMARDFSSKLGVTTQFEVADAFNLRELYGKLDLAYSCGVLEHFDREVTVKLLEEQARCARRVLIQIPTRFTALTGEITDERIYTVRQLSSIVRDAGLRVVCSFGYGDITATPAQVWLRRLLPRIVWRAIQDQGYAYSIAVMGERA